MHERWTTAAIVLATLAAALALLPGLGTTPLVDWDESIYADVGRAVLGGSPWQLEFNGDPYHRKPPLLFWAIAAAYEAFGVNELSTRLPSALAGVATVAVVATAVGRRSGPLAALLGTAFLLGSTLFLERGGRRACTDALLILFSTIALWQATGGPRTRARTITAGVAVGLAVLSKGAAGIVAPVALLLAAPRDAERRRLVGGMMLVATLVAGPWYLSQLWFGGASFVASHVGHELVQRAVRPIHGDGAPWSYPLTILWESGGAWVAVVPLVVLFRLATEPATRAATLPWLWAAGLVLGAAMTMQTKLPWYPLPALPMLAVAGGMALAPGARLAFSRGRRIATAALCATALIAGLSSPQARRLVLEDELQFEPFRTLGAQIAELLGDEPFIGATQENPTLVFYGGRPIRVYPPEELSRLLLDPRSLPRAALVPETDAPTLIDLGAEELVRFGDRVLVRYAPTEG